MLNHTFGIISYGIYHKVRSRKQTKNRLTSQLNEIKCNACFYGKSIKLTTTFCCNNPL